MQYIIILIAVASSLMAAFVVVYIHEYSNVIIEYDIKKNLSAKLNKNVRYFSADNGELNIMEQFEYEEDGIFSLIITEEGEILAGKYPKGISDHIDVEPYKTRRLKINGIDCYVRDVRNGRLKGERVYLRGIIRTSDVSSHYKTVVSLSYIGILIIYILTILIGVFLAWRFSLSMQKMMQTADAIGREYNVFGRMEYQGRYKELRVLVEANNRMLDRMEQQIRQQEQFASDVAHELRTPVAVVLAQCEYVREHPDCKDETDAAFDVIYRQSQKINRIISQLLYLSRLEQGRMQLQADEVDLVEIVESVCEDEQEKAGGHVLITKSLKPAEAMVDINLIALAIQNLITNAIKFSEEGGTIEVSCGLQDDEVFVSVKDYGKGIPEEEMSHIFERFYKVDKSRNSEGFGLGLAITKKVMEMNHGTIEVESRLQKGSTFVLKLPAKKQK